MDWTKGHNPRAWWDYTGKRAFHLGMSLLLTDKSITVTEY